MLTDAEIVCAALSSAYCKPRSGRATPCVESVWCPVTSCYMASPRRIEPRSRVFLGPTGASPETSPASRSEGTNASLSVSHNVTRSGEGGSDPTRDNRVLHIQAAWSPARSGRQIRLRSAGIASSSSKRGHALRIQHTTASLGCITFGSEQRLQTPE